MKAMDKWVAEFFLRRQQNPRISGSTLISTLNTVDPSDESVNLKKTAVLRDISNSLIRGTINEETLDLLEIHEKLLLQEHSVITESLKSAYCLTAVECTVKFMWPETASDGLFGDALERIWRKRIGMLKERESGLVSDELLKWESDMVRPEMYQKIREGNVRCVAMSHLNRFLDEQWGILGCSALELEAQKRIVEGRVGGNGDVREEVSDDDDEEVESVENPDGVDEDEQCRNKRGIAVAWELRDLLLEIEGFVDSPARKEEEENSDIDQSVDATPQAETGGGEDSHGTSSSSVRARPRLPTPEPLNVSPLRKGNLATPRPRRKMKFWTPEEVEALKEGVKEYGKSWKDIKNSNPVLFADRTEVDLKDKWRNYMGR